MQATVWLLGKMRIGLVGVEVLVAAYLCRCICIAVQNHVASPSRISMLAGRSYILPIHDSGTINTRSNFERRMYRVAAMT